MSINTRAKQFNRVTESTQPQQTAATEKIYGLA